MTAASSFSLPRAAASRGALVATDVTHAYGERVVVHDISLTVAPGRRLALVGDNGSGKSTLLRLLAGAEQPDVGSIMRPDDAALLEQDLAHGANTTIAHVVESALAELRDATRRVQELSALVQRIPDDAAITREYGDALEWAQLREAWDADHRVDRVLRGLGLAHMPRTRRIAQLSGGERARVAMAVLLVLQPTALLLDEPTNHLDDAAVAFLERHLRRLPGVVVVASHDRAFLDATCTELLDLDPARGDAVRFGGTFTAYLAHKRRERARWERAWLDRSAELAALQRAAGAEAETVSQCRPARDNDKSLHNFKGARVQSALARRRRNARMRIEVLERDPIPRPPDELRFGARLGIAARSDEPLVVARGLQLDDRLDATDLAIAPGGRLLVTGPNGSGKSTLLSLLAGTEQPTAGTLAHRDGLTIGYLPQDPTFTEPRLTPRQLAAAAHPGQDVPALEELGLLREEDLDRPIGILSEGQRRRIALALVVQFGPELLLLDEPTNHLSPTLVSELEHALLAAPCAVVVATHDRWLRERWTGRLLQVEPRRAQ